MTHASHLSTHASHLSTHARRRKCMTLCTDCNAIFRPIAYALDQLRQCSQALVHTIRVHTIRVTQWHSWPQPLHSSHTLVQLGHHAQHHDHRHPCTIPHTRRIYPKAAATLISRPYSGHPGSDAPICLPWPPHPPLYLLAPAVAPLNCLPTSQHSDVAALLPAGMLLANHHYRCQTGACYLQCSRRGSCEPIPILCVRRLLCRPWPWFPRPPSSPTPPHCIHPSSVGGSHLPFRPPIPLTERGRADIAPLLLTLLPTTPAWTHIEGHLLPARAHTPGHLSPGLLLPAGFPLRLQARASSAQADAQAQAAAAKRECLGVASKPDGAAAVETSGSGMPGSVHLEGPGLGGAGLEYAGLRVRAWEGVGLGDCWPQA
ncbi:hypothetical protein V8C86DRAFT_2873054 [Haematococcus lacustris]